MCVYVNECSPHEYEYIMDNDIKDIYEKDISEIQKEYRHYPLSIKDFKKVNTFFCNIAEEFVLKNALRCING